MKVLLSALIFGLACTNSSNPADTFDGGPDFDRGPGFDIPPEDLRP